MTDSLDIDMGPALSAADLFQSARPVVLVKRRRLPAVAAEAASQDMGPQEKAARVFQVGKPTLPAAADVAPADPAPMLRRRRRDPLRAPGEVVRIVFEPPPVPPPPQPEAAGLDLGLPENDAYGQIVGALQDLRGVLGQARVARAFRVLG